jgi:hypothetical protein
MIKLDYKHRHSAHCENGVTAGLFSHHGLEISEAMVFGIGSGLFFGYAPFMKIGSLPLTTYRIMPGQVFKKAAKRLGVQWTSQRFRSHDAAMNALDDGLKSGIPVACQTGAYWLPYFPESMRFHFNAHNIVVYGKDGDTYLISDPVMDEPTTIEREPLIESRFAKGAMAPKGRIYYPTYVPSEVDMRPGIIKAIKETCFSMLSVPFVCAGVRGIRFLSRRLAKWPDRMGAKKASRYLGSVIRMQEEIGTGGAGFRFIYAAFLQECAHLFEEEAFNTISDELTETGDQWREFARLGARNCKARASAEESYERLGAILADCADREEAIYKQLRKLVKGIRL